MKKEVLIAIVALLTIAIIVGLVFLSRSEFMRGLQAHELVEQRLREETLSMELIVNARLADSHLNFSALIERSTWENHKITTVASDGHTLCYTEGVVLTENGRAYRISDAYPDYSRLLEISLEVYKDVQVEAEKGVYTITATGQDAQDILAVLLPGIEAKAEKLTVELVSERQKLTQLHFEGALTQDGKSCDIAATLRILGNALSTDIPEAVQTAIRNGKVDAALDLSEDLLRLLGAWERLSGDEAMATELKLSAECSLLKLNSSLRLYRKGKISAIEKYGLLLYFNDRAICDKNGNSIPTSDASAVEAGKLMDLAWELAMEGRLDVLHTGNLHTYTLALDKTGMIAATQAISPEIDPQDMTFQSGSIVLTLRGDQLQSIRFQISGELKMLMLKAPITLSAQFTMLDNVRFEIPDAVQNALG